MSLEKPTITKTTKEARLALQRASAYGLPTRPGERGMKAEDVKKAFWKPFLDANGSLLAELDRVIDELNSLLAARDENGEATEALETRAKTLVGAINELLETVESISTEIGEEPLSTKAKTLSGAVNELHGREETKQSVVQYSGNLFNSATVTKGKRMTISNGVLSETDLEGSSISDYIPCAENTVYTTLSFKKYYGGYDAVAFYDFCKTPISKHSVSSSSTDEYVTFTAPVGARYMRLNLCALSSPIMMVVEGAVYPEEYKPYGKELIDIGVSGRLNSRLNFSESTLTNISAIIFEQGQISTSTGQNVNSDYYIRSKSYLSKDVKYISTDSPYYAFNLHGYIDGVYQGVWNGSEFQKRTTLLPFDLRAYEVFTDDFAGYDLKLDVVQRNNYLHNTVDKITPQIYSHVKVLASIGNQGFVLDYTKANLSGVETDAVINSKINVAGVIVPKQEGSEPPSPTNKRAIFKTDSVTIAVGNGTVTDEHVVHFPTPVYLGDFDLVAGTYTERGEVRTYNGTEAWKQLGNTFYIGVGTVDRSRFPCDSAGLTDEDFACDSYKNVADAGGAFYNSDESIAYCCCLGNSTFGSQLAVNDPRFNTIEEWQAHLQESNLTIVFRSTNVNAEYSLESVPNIIANGEYITISTSDGRFTAKGKHRIEAVNLQNPLYKKSALFMGDSICWAGDRTATDKVGRGWAGRIGAYNNMTVYNYGVSGARISKDVGSNGGRHCMSEFIDTVYATVDSVDYVILEGGTNDADYLRDAPDRLGTFDETDFGGEYDNTTFYGALDMLFHKATTYYPNAKIGYIVAQQMGKAYDDSAVRRRQYFEYAMQVCKKWSIPFINLWDEGQITPNLLVYYDSTLSKDENEAQGKAYLDAQHLTAKGYDIISSKINAWMKML